MHGQTLIKMYKFAGFSVPRIDRALLKFSFPGAGKIFFLYCFGSRESFEGKTGSYFVNIPSLDIRTFARCVYVYIGLEYGCVRCMIRD